MVLNKTVHSFDETLDYVPPFSWHTSVCQLFNLAQGSVLNLCFNEIQE